MTQDTVPTTATYRGLLKPLGDVTDLDTKWRTLEADADCSFFLSWSWIGTWLTLARSRAELYVYECYLNDTLIALSVISVGSIKRRLFFQSTIIAINEASRKELDMFIEYNGVLARRGCEATALNQLAQDLHTLYPHWDELKLTNIPADIYSALEIDDCQVSHITDEEKPVWIAALGDITTLDSVFGKMSKNRRWQIRRSFKEYQKEGELTIDAATSSAEAQHFFLQMGILHTERWNRSGKDGAFARTDWVTFHQNLIDAAFDRGETQLLRIRCGNRAIGYIYNFVWRKSVLMLQSGFASESSNLLRPGYISHVLAIHLNAQQGAAQYDFMTGDSEYKRVLGIAHPPLISARLQRKRLKFSVENTLVDVYRALCRFKSINLSTKLQSHVSGFITWLACLDVAPLLQSSMDTL